MADNTGTQTWSWMKIARILVKTTMLFIVFNLIFASFDFWPLIGKLSVYNTIVPGRLRLPYGSDPERSYNLTISQLDVMIASHEIAGEAKTPDEYRILVLGDSSVWGFLLQPGETLPAQLDAGAYRTTDGRRIQVYNFGYPTMSLTKDLLLLSRGLEYDPDLIVWFFTLESFWRENQIEAPLVQYNPNATRDLIHTFRLDLDPADPRFQPTMFWQRTIFGQRRELANAIRLQCYGVMWASTGLDRYIALSEDRNERELPEGFTFHGLQPGGLEEEHLAFDVLAAGVDLAGEVPVVLINEPIYIHAGEGSDLFYNAAYPRWAYDAYREWLRSQAEKEGWRLLDLWDWLPADSFADSGVHYDAEAASSLAAFLVESIWETVYN
jgi:hypothetical protein